MIRIRLKFKTILPRYEPYFPRKKISSNQKMEQNRKHRWQLGASYSPPSLVQTHLNAAVESSFRSSVFCCRRWTTTQAFPAPHSDAAAGLAQTLILESLLSVRFGDSVVAVSGIVAIRDGSGND